MAPKPPFRSAKPLEKRPKPPRDAAKNEFAEFTPERKKPGLAARGSALDILRLVRKGRSLDEALSICRTFDALEGPDRAFARDLVSTVLRRQGSLDEVIDTYLNTPLKPGQTELRALLRLAAAQILILGLPAHAAASTSVDLAKERREMVPYAKLVNAIARRMTETGKDRLDAVHIRADTPGWLWRQLERIYGPDRTRAMAEMHRTVPPLDLTVRPGEEMATWADLLQATIVGPRTVRRHGGGRIEELPGFEQGSWWVQDVAASLPALLAGDVAGKVVFDLCAAPGGKTMQLAAAGAAVTAVDISLPRMDILKQNLERTQLSATAINADLIEWQPDTLADVILLDAPCSATGTIRRNPDLLWTKDETEPTRLAALQDKMIDRALTFLKPGGLLIFATCSLMPEEGEKRVDAALQRHPDLTREAVTPEEVGSLPVINKHGDLRCLPSMLAEDGGMDGFFAARLRKA